MKFVKVLSFLLLLPLTAQAADFDLLQYMRDNVSPLTAAEALAALPKYDRLEMFGTWVNEDAPDDCLNTRAEVLIRDAVPGSIELNPANACQVRKGEWKDPYTGTVYRLASAVQIDHVVPLRNAYRSGAHAWSRERRCHYTNFLRQPQHLLAVSGHENMSKGDHGPEAYLPPNAAFTCEYLADWLTIKATWELSFTADEKSAIETEWKDSRCKPVLALVNESHMQRDRAETLVINEKCVETAP